MLKHTKLKLALAISGAFLAFGSQANVVTFDDITTAGIAGFTTTGGFNWTNALVVNKNAMPNTGYSRGVISGDYSAWSPSTLSVKKADNSSFTFNSGYFTSAWDSSQTLKFDGYVGGTNSFTQTVNVNNLAATFLDLNWAGIDKLTIQATNARQFVLDNLAFNEAVVVPNAVPEPTSIALLGMGALGFAASRRKKSV